MFSVGEVKHKMPEEDTPSLEYLLFCPQVDQALNEFIQSGYEVGLDDTKRTCQN